MLNRPHCGSHLSRPPIAAFSVSAVRALKPKKAAIVLIDRSYQQPVDTLKEYGASFPLTSTLQRRYDKETLGQIPPSIDCVNEEDADTEYGNHRDEKLEHHKILFKRLRVNIHIGAGCFTLIS